MKLSDIALIRLMSQQLATTTFKHPKQLVSWMGAMQAQDYAMCKLAIGSRIPNVTEEQVEASISKGEILRTHVLRPTWHLVSPKDIRWMLQLTAPTILRGTQSRHKQLELTDKLITKSNTLIENALGGGKHLTREELMRVLQQAKIRTDENRLSHLLFCAELAGIACSGEIKGKKQTYALLADRVKETKSISREEALVKLATVYFQSHCPATLQDFTWWSGLPVADARHALETIKPSLLSDTIGTETYWFTQTYCTPKVEKNNVYLLPAYDEYLISYKDRTASLVTEHNAKALSVNGIFFPVMVMDGKVIGLWKRSFKKEQVLIETVLFKSDTKAQLKRIERAAQQYGDFMQKEMVITHTLYS